MNDEYEETVGELISRAEHAQRVRRGRRRTIGIWTKAFVLGAVLIAVASAGLAAVVLFTQTPTYTSVAMLSMGCASPTGTASGTLITFTCPTGAALKVSSSAAGFVSYSSFTVPSNVTDVYLIDTLATSNTTCSHWSSTGATNVNLAVAGGSITIGTTLGRIQPGHSYEYCVDYSSAPPTFSFSITWSQG